jgi:hypothetical protein
MLRFPSHDMRAGLRWSGGAAVLIIAVVLAAAAAEAGWLTKVMGAAERSGLGAAQRGPAALEAAARYVKALPLQADGAALAGQATQEGHWRFINAAGETLTAGTPEELDRLRSVLLPDAKAGAKLSLYLTEDTVFQQRGALKDLPRGSDLNLLVGGESYRLIKSGEGAGERLIIEVRPHLVVEAAERALFEEAVWQLARPLKRANMRVLALEPGGPSTLASTPRLDAASNRALIDVIDPASLPAALGAVRGQTVVVTGRIDGQLLYVKPSSGPDRSILMGDLFAAAEQADVNIVVLQSAATPRQPGGRNWLWQKVQVKGLDDALEHTRVADFLNALGGLNGRFEVTATPVGSARTILIARPAADLPGGLALRPIGDMLSDIVSDLTGRVATSGVQANVRSGARQQELDRRIIPTIPASIQFGYLYLFVLGLLGLPVSRTWWRGVWPPERAQEYAGPVGYWAARVVRGAGFLFVFLPLSAPLSAPLHAGKKIWEVVTAPLRWWRWLTRRRVAPVR